MLFNEIVTDRNTSSNLNRSNFVEKFFIMIISDKELLEAIRNKDQDAFSELYNRYWKLLYSWSIKRIYDQEAVRDLLQNIWIDIWENPLILKTDANGSVRSILLSFTTFRILDFFKKKDILVFPTDNEDYLNEEHNYSHILEELEIKEIHAHIEQSLSKISDFAREIYFLSENENLPVREIALKLSVTEETVRRRLKWVNDYVRRDVEKYLNIDSVNAILILMTVREFMSL